jgi:hypothetical protein
MTAERNKYLPTISILLLLALVVFAGNAFSAPMTLTFNTALGLSGNNDITLPLKGTVNVTVDWGDGTATNAYTTAGDVTHTYAAPGIYNVAISGSLGWFGDTTWNGCDNIEKLIGVTSFGDIGLTDLSRAFLVASNLVSVPTQVPATVTNMSWMFGGAVAFNQDIGG